MERPRDRHHARRAESPQQEVEAVAPVRIRRRWLPPALLLLSSCVGGKPARPPALIPPPKVFVRLDSIRREHPALEARRWNHALSVRDSAPAATTAPLQARSLSLDFAQRSAPDEPIKPLYPAPRERAQVEERAALDATFARARGRETSTARFYAEERQLTLEDEL